MASRALVFACILLYCQSLILGGSSKTIRGGSYQDGQEFQKRIEDILTDLRDSDVHSRIMAVNHAHRTHQDEAGRDNQAPKNKSIDIEEDIVETNLEQGVHLFEGDIDLTPEQAKIIHGVPTALDKRTAGQQSRMNLWHDRFIPYIVAPVLRNKRHVIRKAVDIFKRDTCLRFVEIRKHAPKSNYIYFDRRQGCHSTIGKSGFKRRQVLSLGHGCGSVGLILHEMTHAIGFWHEQARMDRNKYVKVIWGNILKGNDYNFERHDIGSVDTLGLPYDYTSLMHYGKTTFTRNGGDTLERIDDPKAPLGRSEGSFSPTDKISINALYECNKYSASYLGFSSWSSWIPMEWQCKSARQRFCMNIVNVYHREKYCSGADRNGVQVEYRDLPPSQCGPRDGGWGRWGRWETCSATCGQGTRKRKRECDNPFPLRKGKKCVGSADETAQCPLGKCKLTYYETQFEGNMGSWKPEGPGYLKWVIESFWRTPGPQGDHTTGEGKWIYVPTQGSSMYQGKAKLVNNFGWGDPFCLSFYYSMDGPSVGTLSVVVRILNSNDRRSWSVFTAKGPKGKGWHLATAFVNAKNKNLEVTIEAWGNGSDKPGSIAIDDLYYSKRCPKPPTAIPTVPPCIDINQKCEQWAYEGECSKNVGYMKKFCRKSCVCQPVKCVDTNKGQCPYWGSTDECAKNEGWMRKHCCVTCRKELGCSDNKKYTKKCPKWAKKGECAGKNASWMKKNCCKSCKKEHECVDNEKYKDDCPRWAKKGECSKNTSFMKKHCCRSCKTHA